MEALILPVLTYVWTIPLLTIVLLWICYETLKSHSSRYRHIIAPKQKFFLRLFSEPKVKQIEQWMDQLPHNGLIRYYGLNNVERIYVASPEAARDLLAQEAYKFTKPELQYVLAQNIASNGLLILEGEAHKKARKALNPAFSPAQMKDLYPIAFRTSVEMLGRIANEIEKGATGEVMPLNILHGTTIDILGRWAFSVDFNVVTDPKSLLRPYVGMFKQSWRGQITFNVAAVIGPRFALKLPLRAVETMRAVMKVVRDTADEIVAQHLHGRYSCTLDEPLSDSKRRRITISDDHHRRQDLISTVVKSSYFSQEGLVDQTVHMLAAATETSSGTLSWIVHLLSRYPDWQEKIRKEVREHLPSPNGRRSVEPQRSDFQDMVHLNAFIKEVLRFHSINTVWWRQCIEPATIAGETIHPGTIVSWSPWALARDPKYWGADARTFRPQRWIEDVRGGVTDQAAWVIFGAGPKRCIGEQYAYAQMQAMVAALVGRYEIFPMDYARGTDEGHELGDDAALTLFKIMDGWKLRFREVEGW